MNSFHLLLHILALWAALSVHDAFAIRPRSGLRGNDASTLDAPQLTIRLSPGYWKNAVAKVARMSHSASGSLDTQGDQTTHVSLFQNDVAWTSAGVQSTASLFENSATLTDTEAENSLPDNGTWVVMLVGVAMLVLLCVSYSYFFVAIRGTPDPIKSTFISGSSAQRPSSPRTSQHSAVLQSGPKRGAPNPPSRGALDMRQHPMPVNSPVQSLLTVRTSPQVASVTPPHFGSAPASQTAVPPASHLSTALMVRSQEGVILQPDKKCAPTPERCTINFRSAKGANSVVLAKVDELAGQQRIMVETASGVPLALVDTTEAHTNRPRDNRYVNIHRATAGSFHLLGGPCATVLPLSSRLFEVHSVEERKVMLTVHCDGSGFIQEMRDSTGNAVMRQDSAAALGTTHQINLWIGHGSDISLMVCVILAVWKLA